MRLDPYRVAPTPWLNGAGSTRELAVSKDRAGLTWWRISLAELDRPAPFSAFPEMDRLFVSLGTVRLQAGEVITDLRAGDQIRFDGGARVTATLAEPLRALNVMTRRGHYRAEVELRSVDAPVTEGAVGTVLLGDFVADVVLIQLRKEFDA